MASCDHPTPQWRLTDCNEDGWHCAECDTKLGFRPDFDRVHLDDKVHCVLFWLVEQDFYYVSNASEADGLVSEIVKLCRAADEYDQQTILYLIAAYGRESNAKYWAEKAKQAACAHASRSLKGDVSVCESCGHEVKQAAAGPLFADVSKEPF